MMKKTLEIHVTGGSFMMGNTRESKMGWEIEHPVHKVFLNYDYFVSECPVTFSEYDDYSIGNRLHLITDYSEKMGYAFGRGHKPVVNVSWWEAAAYCNWLSRENGLPVAYYLDGSEKKGALLDENGQITSDIRCVKGYRLLTEAEWEYAARGGSVEKKDYLFSGGDSLDKVGWYWKNSGEKYLRLSDSKWPRRLMGNFPKTREVRQKKQNRLGLYDMSGNIWEWCHDWFKAYEPEAVENPLGFSGGEQKVIRGGGWFFNSHTCRVSSRFYFTPDCSDFNTGFRVARTA
jgi:formylglycine-generating enzyme required for sulfatase activity